MHSWNYLHCHPLLHISVTICLLGFSPMFLSFHIKFERIGNSSRFFTCLDQALTGLQIYHRKVHAEVICDKSGEQKPSHIFKGRLNAAV